MPAIGSTLNRSVVLRRESRVEEIGGKPDFGVDVDGLLVGHLELKAPGKGAATYRYTGHDREQWRRFENLPNLIYTDGRQWALYRTGERVGRTLNIGDIFEDGADALSDTAIDNLVELVQDYLLWQPIVPADPAQLADLLAPLCRIVRDDVLNALGDADSAMSRLARDWRKALFPDADDFQFADSYAQTLTYALLLARVEGAQELAIGTAAEVLADRHGLLGEALRILGHRRAREEIGPGLAMLLRVIGVVDPDKLGGADVWLYFYEHFLGAYDPRLRKDRGVYYTPPAVIGCQVRLADQLLRERLGRQHGFAGDDVVTLDPACGTGSYLLRVVRDALETVEERWGAQQRPARASVLAENIHGFEILVGPYAVAHLMLTQALTSAGAALPDNGVHVYLTDTLDSPYEHEQDQLPLPFVELGEEHERAMAVKAETRVLVCLGNPPYDRQQIDPDDEGMERKGGWVRFTPTGPSDEPLLDDFLAPARDAGAGVHLKNLYNDYVYFWRWVLWKVFDSTRGPGIATLITAASYLRGPGFVGMRRRMRETFDELWILDLEGDQRGPRKTENVFAIQTPVAIAIGIRHGQPQPHTPATVHYAKLTGTEQEKIDALDNIMQFEDVGWKPARSDWLEPFLPVGEGDYFSWPLLTDLFPWQHSGAQTKRTWVIGPEAGVLRRRWAALMAADRAERGPLMKETRDRKARLDYPPLLRDGSRLTPIADEPLGAEPLHDPVRYSFRSLDRQWLLADPRVCDYLRPALWRSHGSEQIYLTTLLTDPLGLGPSVTAAAHVPDLHHFRGSFGGKDVLPLWRDSAATVPNITEQLLPRMADTYGRPVTAEELFAYCYAVLANPSYTERFSEELAIPGPRVPLTRDAELFARAVELGRRLLFLHTYGERCAPEGVAGSVPAGRARYQRHLPPDTWPEGFEYVGETETLMVDEAEFAPVAEAVWDFEVSGLQVVSSWLDYRTGSGAGRSSSELDELRPHSWTAGMIEELLELLWVVEHTIELAPELDALLADVIGGPVFEAESLPKPADGQRDAPVEDEGPPEEGQQALFD